MLKLPQKSLYICVSVYYLSVTSSCGMVIGWDDAELAGFGSGSGSPGLIGKLHKNIKGINVLYLSLNGVLTPPRKLCPNWTKVF